MGNGEWGIGGRGRVGEGESGRVGEWESGRGGRGGRVGDGGRAGDGGRGIGNRELGIGDGNWVPNIFSLNIKNINIITGLL